MSSDNKPDAGEPRRADGETPPPPVDAEYQPSAYERIVDEWRSKKVLRAADAIPRFGVIHLLGWIGCIGIYMAAARMVVEEGGPYPPTVPIDAELLDDYRRGRLSSWPIDRIVLFAQSPIAGATLGGAVPWLVWRRRGIEFPGQPGESLLAVQGIDLAIQLPLVIATAWQLPTFGLILFYIVFRAGLYYRFVLRARGPQRWQEFLACFLVQSIACCLAAPLALALLLIIAIDLRDRRQFSWLHWVGVGVTMWQLLAGTLLYPGALWWELVTPGIL